MRTSFKSEIAQFLSKKFSKPESDFLNWIDLTPSIDKGAYTLPCFPLAKVLKRKPNEIAKDICDSFPTGKSITKVVAAGPYVNFHINTSAYLGEIITEVLKHKGAFGNHPTQNKKVIIEYSSPNIAKSFHVGHFRATIIGNALKHLFKAAGYDCVGINYLGDWGTQFGKLITAFKKWGSEDKLKDHPVTYLNSLYVRFHEEAAKNADLDDEARAWFKKCEDGDTEALRLWKIFKEASLKEFDQIYKMLNISFDELSGESVYDSHIPDVVKEVKACGKSKISEGALIVDLEAFNMPPALILRRDGASLYLTRDLAALRDRHSRYQFSQMLYVVGGGQTLHFTQLFKVAELLGIPGATECHHISFGLIRLKDKKMSTRKGTTILFEDLISRAVELISKIIEEKNPNLKGKKETAERVGIGALIFADFGSRRNKDVVFDWEIILNPEGDTGPYVMYTYARASSILRKAATSTKECPKECNDWSLLKSNEELELVRWLEKFPNMIVAATRSFEPSSIASYLIDLSHRFNRFYHEHRVIQDDKKIESLRLKLVQATRQVLKNGMNLIGVQEVEEL